MANNKRKVYFSALQLCRMLSNEIQQDRNVIKNEIFDPIISEYAKAEENGDFSRFQRKYGNENDVYMVSMLHYEGNIVCGLISHGMPRIERFLRERNPETFNVKELVPTEGNVFEEYTFFAISIPKMQMAYLSDSAISANIPALALTLFRPTLNINYIFEETSLLDTDVKKKVKELGNRVVIKGTLVGKEEIIIGGDQSLRSLENTMGTKFSAVVKMKANPRKPLSEEDIDNMVDTARSNDAFSSFTFADSRSTDKEVIDVIKNYVRYSKGIELTPEERRNPDVVWRKLCSAFN